MQPLHEATKNGQSAIMTRDIRLGDTQPAWHAKLAKLGTQERPEQECQDVHCCSVMS